MKIGVIHWQWGKTSKHFYDLTNDRQLANLMGENIMLKISLIGFVMLCAVMACGCMEGTEVAKSVELRGYNFTFNDADGWFSDTDIEEASYSTRLRAGSYGGFTVDEMQRDLWLGWGGSAMERAFYKPDSNHDASVSQRKYMDGVIALYVLDPIDSEDLTYDTALEEAVYLPNDYINKDIMMDEEMDKKETTIDGKDAYLILHPNDKFAVASVQLDSGLIVVISVDDDNGRPEDLIRKFTISEV